MEEQYRKERTTVGNFEKTKVWTKLSKQSIGTRWIAGHHRRIETEWRMKKEEGEREREEGRPFGLSGNSLFILSLCQLWWPGRKSNYCNSASPLLSILIYLFFWIWNISFFFFSLQQQLKSTQIQAHRKPI